MHWLVANFDFSSVKSKSMDGNYKTALRLAKRIENSSEGWIYDALKARSGEPSSQEKARRMAEDRSSQEIVNKWVSTDVVAYMSTRDGSTIEGVGIVGQLRDKRGRWFHRPLTGYIEPSLVSAKLTGFEELLGSEKRVTRTLGIWLGVSVSGGTEMLSHYGRRKSSSSYPKLVESTLSVKGETLGTCNLNSSSIAHPTYIT
jgi:hypothetical protein